VTHRADTFCVVPWLHRLLDERGFVKVCSVGTGRGNYLENGPDGILHVQDGWPEDAIQNHRRLKALRRTMLAGRWDPMCARCQDAERSGGSSSRTGRNHHLRQHVAGLAEDTARDGRIATARIRHVDLRLGNHCNLTCRMCTPISSKPWIDAYDRVQPAAYRMGDRALASLRDVDWQKDPRVWERFAHLIRDVEWLHFAGGEPLLVPEMFLALKIAVDSGSAGRIHLSYNTNLTVLPGRVAELWPHFKCVSVASSVDGYGRLNDYIRRPSRWRDVDRHLHTLDRDFAALNLAEVRLTTTTQILNVLDLGELYAYLRSEFAHVLPLPELNILTWPAYLSVQSLPAPLKPLARERLLRERARPEYATTGLQWLLDSIDSLLAYMDAADTVHLQDFVTFTVNADREFGDSLEEAAPELARFLSWNDITARRTAADGLKSSPAV
jgi:MoaA/NifB/PqqE/SkfB family radical SAM enzyme